MTETDTTRRFVKQVAIKATDDDEMTATGVVLTPNELDHQLDWFDSDGVEAMYTPEPNDGVMHSAFPEGHSSLERNEVLDSAEEIDGVEFAAGDWVVTRKYHDPQRWSLVKGGTLAAFSMGGEISEVVEFETVDALPDEVNIPEGVDPESVDPKYQPPTQVVDGEVTEISDVDVGAVPSADMAVVKTIGKNVLEDTNGRDEFVALMESRGTERDDAEELYEYMVSVNKADGKPFGPWETFDECVEEMMEQGNDEEAARQICGSLEEGLKNNEMTQDIESVDDEAIGKRFKRFLTELVGTDDAEESGEEADKADEVEKAGQTLSRQNQHAVMAAVDAQLDVLSDAGVEHGMIRFSDSERFPEFDVSNYGKAYDKQKTKTMTTIIDDDAFAEKLEEHGVVTAEETAKQIEEVLEKHLGESDADGDESEKADETPEWAESLVEKVEENSEAIESIAKQSGASTQIKTADSDETDAELSEEEKLEQQKRRIFLPKNARGD